ncbi:MAG: S41 family peptidase [Acidobacteriota bacterium]
MSLLVVACVYAGTTAISQRAADTPEPLASFAEPGLAPDGSEIAVVSAGDIWTVPARGGEARLLVSHEASESRPMYAPDGRSLAFISDRTGGGDIYVLTLATGMLRQLKVTEVIPLGPAAVSGQVAVGDVLLSIEGRRIGPDTNLDQVLMHGLNRRVAVTVAKPGAAEPREVLPRPVSVTTEKNLLYREWVEANRRYVERTSEGRLGYAHMNDMSEGALRRLYMDLDADNRLKDGVVIDVRNNNGGFVNVYAIDVLARRGYMNMTPRDLPMAPARTQLGQRALERPTFLVTNQHSLSDAKDFTEGYRTLRLGKVVGEPTAGWIIYTGSQTLVDGTAIRMPSTRITTLQGVTMERNPRPVDVAVTRPIGESLSGKDSHFDAAVRELLSSLSSVSPQQ